jgi:hypothetical protein
VVRQFLHRILIAVERAIVATESSRFLRTAKERPIIFHSRTQDVAQTFQKNVAGLFRRIGDPNLEIDVRPNSPVGNRQDTAIH